MCHGGCHVVVGWKRVPWTSPRPKRVGCLSAIPTRVRKKHTQAQSPARQSASGLRAFVFTIARPDYHGAVHSVGQLADQRKRYCQIVQLAGIGPSCIMRYVYAFWEIYAAESRQKTGQVERRQRCPDSGLNSRQDLEHLLGRIARLL